MGIKIIYCKSCGKVGKPLAKLCPSCGRKVMGFGKKSLIGIGAFFVLRIIQLASKKRSNPTPKTATPSPSSKPSAPVLPALATVVSAKEVTTANVNIKVIEVTNPDNTVQDSVKDYPHGSWVVVKLSIQNNHKDAINVTSTNYKLQDQDKRQFTILMGETVGLEMNGKVTSFLTVNPGNTVEGYLAYDVPKGLACFTMEDSECVTGTPTKLIRQ